MTTTIEVSPGRVIDAAFAGGRCEVVSDDGTVQELSVRRWQGHADESDHALFVQPCDGHALDVGCGPGRLTAALETYARTALGIDVSREAIRQARIRGANVLHHDVFEYLPVAGWWDHVLLADGNIGIGGDPVRILYRVAQLARSGGRILVELDPPGGGVVHHLVRLRVDDRVSEPIAWATVDIDAIEDVAGSAGLDVESVAQFDGRYVATLVPHEPRG